MSRAFPSPAAGSAPTMAGPFVFQLMRRIDAAPAELTVLRGPPDPPGALFQLAWENFPAWVATCAPLLVALPPSKLTPSRISPLLLGLEAAASGFVPDAFSAWSSKLSSSESVSLGFVPAVTSAPSSKVSPSLSGLSGSVRVSKLSLRPSASVSARRGWVPFWNSMCSSACHRRSPARRRSRLD